jgi:hypothetical protein
VLVDVSGDFSGEANLYTGCGASASREAVFRIASIAGLTQSVTLTPGVYVLAVEDHDPRPHRGAYVLRLRLVDHDPEIHLH